MKQKIYRHKTKLCFHTLNKRIEISLHFKRFNIIKIPKVLNFENFLMEEKQNVKEERKIMH